MACLHTQSLWVTGNSGAGLNRSHVPHDQRSIGNFPIASERVVSFTGKNI